MFDLVIIGGGITGAALAYSAVHAERPLRVLLVERGDLGSGTSSRSSGLLHGGLRYLGQGRLGLVRRLLRGRRCFARLAPHLVRPAPFLLPIQGSGRRPAWVTQLALGLYHLCDGGRPIPGLADAAGLSRPVRLRPAQALLREPLLGETAARGAFAYGELSVDGRRLVEELAAGAAAAGAVVLTGTRCERLVMANGRVTGAWLRPPTGATVRVDAGVVVDATGPWSGQLEQLLPPEARPARRPPLRLSRGSHLVLSARRLPLSSTVVISGPDGRAMFAGPRDGAILVGTTEVEHRWGVEHVFPTSAEVRYLVAAASAAFPRAKLRPADVEAAFSGVRPLAANDGEDLGALDRGYQLDWPAPGLLAIRGGKLTLALSAARQALELIARRAQSLGVAAPRPRAEHLLPPLPGASASESFTPSRRAA